jgi:hypothetical protein
MKKASMHSHESLIAYNHAAEMAEPGACMLCHSTSLIAPQLAPILVGRWFMGGSGRNNRVNSPPGQSRARRIDVIAPARYQSLGAFPGPTRHARAADGDGVERRFEEQGSRRGSRLQIYAHRDTRPIDQNHPLCAHTGFGLPELSSPLLAGMKLPSAKHLSQHSLCRSLSWAKKAGRSIGNSQVCSQCLSHCQQELGLPYRWSSSLHQCPGTEHPEYARNTTSILDARSPASRGSLLQQRDANRLLLWLAQSLPCYVMLCKEIFLW